MTKPVKQVTWGIIRYAPGSGMACDDDAAGFDGWYSARADALDVAKDWVARFPQWIVGLVSSDQVWFGDGDFTSVCDRPLTTRERDFADGKWRNPHLHDDQAGPLRDPLEFRRVEDSYRRGYQQALEEVRRTLDARGYNPSMLERYAAAISKWRFAKIGPRLIPPPQLEDLVV